MQQFVSVRKGVARGKRREAAVMSVWRGCGIGTLGGGQTPPLSPFSCLGTCCMQLATALLSDFSMLPRVVAGFLLSAPHGALP